MSVETLEQKIAKQEERLRQLKAQKQAIAAREKKKVSDQQRKDDTRRKILLGAWALNKLKNELRYHCCREWSRRLCNRNQSSAVRF